MKKLVLLFVLISLNGSLAAQESKVFFTGIFPEISFTKKLDQQNKLNFKIENQEILYDSRDLETDNPQFTHYRTDLMLIFDHTIRPGISIGLGVFHRFQENEDGNRIIQQLSMLQRLRNLRINHRVRTDQTFTKNDDLEVRLRYRLSVEIPLEGAEVDPSEYIWCFLKSPFSASREESLRLKIAQQLLLANYSIAKKNLNGHWITVLMGLSRRALEPDYGLKLVITIIFKKKTVFKK